MNLTNFLRIPFSKKWKGDTLLVLLLSILASFVWWRMTNSLALVSEGFMYMRPYYRAILWTPKFFTGFETFAVFFGNIFVWLFSYHTDVFFLIEFIVIMLIDMIFYAMVRVVAKSRFIAFCATLIFAVNYFGNFDIYGQHDSAWFLERVIVSIPLLLLSFLFLHLFLEKKLKKYYIFSIAIYFLGQGLAHFGTLFTAPFLLYPFFTLLLKDKKPGRFYKGILISFPYLAITIFYFLLQGGTGGVMGSNGSLINFILHPQAYQYPEKILRQLSYWSQYPLVLKGLGSTNIFSYRNDEVFVLFAPIVGVVYVVVFIFLYKKLPKMRALLLTVVLGVIASFFLNAYLGVYKIFSQTITHRYLYHPTFLLSIFWALFLWILIRSRRKLTIVIVATILAVYFILNWMLISKSFDQQFIDNMPTRAVYDYIAKTRKSVKDNTLVVVPYPALDEYATGFFTEQLGKGRVRYIADRSAYSDWRDISSSYPFVIRLRYEDDCKCILEEKIK